MRRKHRSGRGDGRPKAAQPWTRPPGPIELAARRRALRGDEERIYQGGKLVRVRVRPSDAMLRVLLEAENPDRFASRSRPTPEAAALIREKIKEEARQEIEEEKYDPEYIQEVRDRLDKRLERLNKREQREKLAEGWSLDDHGNLIPPGWRWVGLDDWEPSGGGEGGPAQTG